MGRRSFGRCGRKPVRRAVSACLIMRRYVLRPATRALTPTGGFLKGFSFTLNPYVGCAFGDNGGCPFCYVRTLVIAHSEPGPWGSWVIAKSNLRELLEREMATLERTGRLPTTTILMSSATDPYQGWERQLGLSRAALAVILRYRPRRLMIQTRSPLVERDIALLRELGAHLLVSLTVETDDDVVRRAIAPTSPSIVRRLQTARRLRDAGVFVQLAIAPMMPNSPKRFARLAAEAANRVLIDTYFLGDGSNGRRSCELGMGETYRRLGYERWFVPGAERELVEAMKAELGPERVVMSRDGFLAI